MTELIGPGGLGWTPYLLSGDKRFCGVSPVESISKSDSGIQGIASNRLTLTSAEDKKNLRIAEAGVYLEKHVPALGQIAPSLIPHKEAILMFDPWTTAAAMPRLPLWKDMTKKLHMQDVVVGRESGVADLICALVAMVHAHAGPMPDGFLVSSTDTTTITYQKRTVDPVTHVATVANETRPPPESAEAGEIRMYRPLEPGPAASETVMIGGSGVYSSPFRDDGRGGSAAEAYRQWLTGSHTAGALWDEPIMWVCIKAWRVGPSVLEGRLTALLRLVARVRRGERLQLICACKVHTLNSCHGDVIVEWVRGRLRPE